MKLLILGGTGPLGESLVNELINHSEYEVVVTSRKKHDSFGNITYIQGNAKKDDFLMKLFENQSYDCVIDFMLYTCQEFNNRLKLLLNSTQQYIFVSSARVYSDRDKIINEDSPKLLEVEKDLEFLQSDEYSLKKAKQEDMLINSGYKNWVIIRPYKTYYYNRFQLGPYEKEQWIFRALEGKKVVVYNDYYNKLTSLTYAGDTARILMKLIGNTQCNTNFYNIASPNSVTWETIINIYKDWFIRNKNIDVKIVFKEKQDKILESYFNNKYRISKDIMYNRRFNDKKIRELVPDFEWTPLEKGISNSLDMFCKKNYEISKDYILEGYFDRISNEKEKFKNIIGLKNKIKYYLFRYTPIFLLKIIMKFK